MGKIKETILRKQDRPAPERKPPSMRRFKRQDHPSVENSRAGRNSRLTPSRSVNLRSLRRSGEKAGNRTGQFSKDVPASVVFRFKKKHRPVVGVVHEHYVHAQDKTSTKKIAVLTCPRDDSARIKQFEQWEKEGKGKVVYQRRKTIWHRLDKQDMNYKPTSVKGR